MFGEQGGWGGGGLISILNSIISEESCRCNYYHGALSGGKFKLSNCIADAEGIFNITGGRALVRTHTRLLNSFRR